jgi:hypothetical protein
MEEAVSRAVELGEKSASAVRILKILKIRRL